METTTSKKAPPPPPFARRAPAIPKKIPLQNEAGEDVLANAANMPPIIETENIENNTIISPIITKETLAIKDEDENLSYSATKENSIIEDEDENASSAETEYFIPEEVPSDPIPASSETTFDDGLVKRINNTFGADIMSTFITDNDRIGAAYVILQSIINNYISKYNKSSIHHSFSPLDLDKGMNEVILEGIVRDTLVYYNYFKQNSPAFASSEKSYDFDGITALVADDKISVIEHIMEMFKAVSLLDDTNIATKYHKEDETYDEDFEQNNYDESGKSKMWLLAEEIKQSIDEQNAIIDEIAIPVEKKGYPINARRLAANFLKESRRNPELARKLLYENPATFAPILTDRLPSKWFGLVKASPADAVEANRELGRFLQKFVG